MDMFYVGKPYGHIHCPYQVEHQPSTSHDQKASLFFELFQNILTFQNPFLRHEHELQSSRSIFRPVRENQINIVVNGMQSAHIPLLRCYRESVSLLPTLRKFTAMFNEVHNKSAEASSVLKLQSMQSSANQRCHGWW